MKLGYTTEPHITYTPCYTQYGLLRYNVNLEHEKNFLKMYGVKLISECLYIN